ncbi:MAG: flagellin [bacterium]
MYSADMMPVPVARRLGEEKQVQVYNNNMTSSVWKSYTANASNLRGSIAKLSQVVVHAPAEEKSSEVTAAQSLRSKYREASAAAIDAESRINSLQTTDAWLQKAETILKDMSGVALSQAGLSGDESKAAENQGSFELMQEELARIAQKDNRTLFKSHSPADGAVSAEAGDASTAGIPDWLNVLCDPGVNPATEKGAWMVGDAVAAGSVALSDKRRAVGQDAKSIESVLAELRSHVANIRATENRIRDSETAAETMELMTGSIVTQVGTAMLAQANALPGSVMTLVEPAT